MTSLTRPIPALATLAWYRARGATRLRLREMRTPRGLLYLSVSVAALAALLWQPDTLLWENVGLAEPGAMRAGLSTYLPWLLFAAIVVTLLTSSGPALYFNPAELNLLFTAPLPVWSLVVYKFAFYLTGAALSALILALVLPRDPRLPTAQLFIGTLLTLLFVQLVSVSANLASRRWAAFASRQRAAAIALLVLCGAVAATISFRGGGELATVLAWPSTPSGRVLFAPLNVFAELFSPEHSFLWSASWALAINGTLFVWIVHAFPRVQEHTVTASEHAHARWATIRRSGTWGAHAMTARSVSSPRYLAGIGPVVWRQLVSLWRGSRKSVVSFTAMALAAGPILASYLTGGGGTDAVWTAAGLIFFFAVFVIPRTLVFDFRADMAHLTTWKALPLRPMAVATGQILAPVLAASVIETALVLSTAAFADTATRLWLLATLLFIPPLNALLFAFENLLFLLFPTKQVPVGRVDFDFFGRTLLEFVAKSFVLALAISGATLAATLIARSLGGGAVTVVAAVAGVLTLLAFGCVAGAATAFQRLDAARVIAD